MLWPLMCNVTSRQHHPSTRPIRPTAHHPSPLAALQRDLGAKPQDVVLPKIISPLTKLLENSFKVSNQQENSERRGCQGGFFANMASTCRGGQEEEDGKIVSSIR
eukprot:TRINITY_DN5790_c0_g1_i3.p1 TRINITY_DN5790_c0_g1~~TRINITY_DN5790_c0_g1_i3.p1  ORF type:complete len:105 (-),score=11.18 TRINITY_DN5790_c0_g1_i3:80-394(-)